MRNTSKPVLVSQLNTGGGNWRLRWHPHDVHVLLAACMYNGFAVLRCCTSDFRSLALVSMYQSPNKHIAYGADWWQGGSAAGETSCSGSSSSSSADKGRRSLAATCSFYDRQHTLVWLETE
ncbi:hypothetical protein Vretimale_2686 [Volvox reticuliferus]|nr:hypothetical protein Vretimale_2686 [Volvox reticuliferus]